MNHDLLKKQLLEALPEITALRQTFHQQPELRYEEFETAKLVAKTLKSYGYEPVTGIAKTGVMAILDSGKPGKTVALRADMDALPIEEMTDLPFASKNKGVMHACGHDGHTATLLLAAKVLKNYSADFSGKIKFIFQPAEEGGHGAALMIKEGILQNPQVDAIFGYHNMPSFPKHRVSVRTGCILAGALFFEVVIKGVGGHSSAPEKTIDPIYAGSAVIQALQTIVSRNCSPFDPTVVSVTQFHAGTADNIIPASAILRGSIRFVDNASIAFIKQKMTQIITQTCAALGAEATIEYINETPATINSPAETELVRQAALALWGEENTDILARNIMATEDFSFYLQEVPGCFFTVGLGDSAYVHHPQYQFNDDIMPTAAGVLIKTALNYLKI